MGRRSDETHYQPSTFIINFIGRQAKGHLYVMFLFLICSPRTYLKTVVYVLNSALGETQVGNIDSVDDIALE